MMIHTKEIRAEAIMILAICASNEISIADAGYQIDASWPALDLAYDAYGAVTYYIPDPTAWATIRAEAEALLQTGEELW